MNSSDLVAGSDFYYASLYSRGDERARLAAVNALHAEIASIPMKVSDRGVARVKLNWWHDELTQLSAATPRHQLTRAYLHRHGEDPRLISALHALVNGLDLELGGHHMDTRAHQTTWFDATFGPVYAQYAAPASGDETRAAARALGGCIETAYALLLLKPLSVYQLWRLPQTSLDAAGCSWDDIRRGTHRDAILRVIGAETAFTISRLKTLTDTTKAQAIPLRVLLTWARIVGLTLGEMQRDGYRVWLHRVELTPLRKLWCAWRGYWL